VKQQFLSALGFDENVAFFVQSIRGIVISGAASKHVMCMRM